MFSLEEIILFVFTVSLGIPKRDDRFCGPDEEDEGEAVIGKEIKRREL